MYKCYHCSESININEYLSMPVEYDDKSNRFKFMGYYCSWECMKTYNLESNSSYKNMIFNNIQQLYTQSGGNDEVQLNFAPSRTQLKCYGGELSIQEFKKSNVRIPFKTFKYPMIPENVHIERQDNFTLNDSESASETYNNFEISSVPNEPIKLNRSIPRKTNQNTLEKTMGLFKQKE